MLRNTALAILATIGALPLSANALLIDSSPWINEHGVFVFGHDHFDDVVIEGLILTARWSPVDEVLTITGAPTDWDRYYPTANGDSAIFIPAYFTLTAIVTAGSGTFLGGTYAWIAGVEGALEIGVNPGDTLLSGDVLDIETRIFYEAGTDLHFLVNWGLWSLLEIDRRHPSLNFRGADYLTLEPMVISGAIDWWHEPFYFDSATDFSHLMITTRVAEPGVIFLLATGLLILGRRKIVGLRFRALRQAQGTADRRANRLLA